MRIVILGALFLSLLGITYEFVVITKPRLLFSPIIAILSELDPQSRIGKFEFSESSKLDPVYIKVSGATESTTDNDLLMVTEGVESRSYSVRSTEGIPMSGQEFHIVGVRPWVGILTDSEGQAYISISIAPDGVEWAENLSLGIGGEITFNGYRFKLEVLSDQEVEKFIATLKGANKGRWGVVEGDNVHWFDNLLPGTGLELDDGTVYTLLQFREDYQSKEGPLPAIAVLVELNGVKKRKIITTRTVNDSVRLDYSEEDQIWFLATGGGAVGIFSESIGYEPIEIGSVRSLGSESMKIRVEQYEFLGIPVDNDQTPFQEAILQSDKNRIRVRQGEAIRVGDALVRYKRMLSPRDTHYLFSLSADMSESWQLFFGDELALVLGGTRCRIRYSDIDMSQSISLVQLPNANFLRLGIFTLLSAISLFLVVRLSSGRSNSL